MYYISVANIKILVTLTRNLTIGYLIGYLLACRCDIYDFSHIYMHKVGFFILKSFLHLTNMLGTIGNKCNQLIDLLSIFMFCVGVT